jgi:hypothetical protein
MRAVPLGNGLICVSGSPVEFGGLTGLLESVELPEWLDHVGIDDLVRFQVEAGEQGLVE